MLAIATTKFLFVWGRTITSPSNLTESELLDLLPSAATELHKDITAKAFNELQVDRLKGDIAKFSIDDLLKRMETVGPQLTKTASSVALAISRASTLKRDSIFGDGIDKSDWRRWMFPGLVINCKHLVSSQLQTVATAVLRELQTLRLLNHIPPYVAVVDFALEPDQLDAIRGVKADASDEMLRALPKMPRGTCLLSGTYESVKHTVPVKIRLQHTEDAAGGQTPNIFQEMEEKWKSTIEELKKRRT